jgi:hypothetical protein
VETVPLEPPPGYVTVVDGEGNPVGYMPTDNALEPLPTLALGTGPALSGRQVVDAAGNPTGYMVVEIGFITIEQASDPAEVDRLVAEHKAWREEAEQQFLEEFGELPPGSGRPED